MHRKFELAYSRVLSSLRSCLDRYTIPRFHNVSKLIESLHGTEQMASTIASDGSSRNSPIKQMTSSKAEEHGLGCSGSAPCSPAHGMSYMVAPKSVKRKAAEELLKARYSPSCPSPSHPSLPASSLLIHHQHSSMTSLVSSPSQPRKLSSLRPTTASHQDASVDSNTPILVQGCDRNSGCSCSSEPSTSKPSTIPFWCSFPIRIPQVDWRKVNESNPHTFIPMVLAQGFERIVMPEGINVYLVESPVHIKQAIDYLKDSMTDRVISIDLEWRPDGAWGKDGQLLPPNPVAMIQLSSATVCLLIRVSSMGFRLPPEVTKFLQGPDITLLGFAWANSDEKKMQKTFGFGRSSFKVSAPLSLLVSNAKFTLLSTLIELYRLASTQWGSGLPIASSQRRGAGYRPLSHHEPRPGNETGQEQRRHLFKLGLCLPQQPAAQVCSARCTHGRSNLQRTQAVAFHSLVTKLQPLRDMQGAAGGSFEEAKRFRRELPLVWEGNASQEL